MKKLLKRLWQLTGTRTALLCTLLVSMSVQTYLLQQMEDRYGLDRLTDTAPYYFGQLVTLASLTLGGTIIAAWITFRPRAPFAVDPEFPPTEMVYIQGEGETDLCACHGKPVQDGATVLYWPQPAQFVCAEKGRHRR